MKILALLFVVHLSVLPFSVFGQKQIKQIERTENGSLAHVLMQSEKTPQGILLLLPGLGEKPKTVLQKTDLPGLLAEHGITTIIPDPGDELIADSAMTNSLTRLLRTYIGKFNLSELPVVIGGFSRGGAIALRFAEHLVASHATINLKAVFAIDPALDLQRLYFSSLDKIRYNCSNLVKHEGSYTRNYLEKKLGGSPETVPENYIQYSVYSAHADSGGNARFLKNIPLRLYSEPDLGFVKKKYCKELKEEDINAYDLKNLQGLLLKIGNNSSEYITTEGKGFHSWNILDAPAGVDWILGILNQGQKKVPQ